MGNPTHDDTSFNTQPTYVVSVEDCNGEDYFIYLADNWIHAGPDGLIDAGYVWLPMWYEGDAINLYKQANWSMADPFNSHP